MNRNKAMKQSMAALRNGTLDRTKTSALVRRRAMALLVVLVLVMLAAFSAYSFMFTMESQYRDARIFEEQLSSQQAAKSGMEIAAALLELNHQQREKLGGLVDNPELFCSLIVEPSLLANIQTESRRGWRVSIISPKAVNQAVVSSLSSSTISNSDSNTDRTKEPNNFVFGLENESAKIPIGALLKWEQRAPGHAKRALMNLPGATSDLVDMFLRSLHTQNSSKGSGRLSSGSDRPRSMAHPVEQLQMLWLGGDLNCNYRRDLIDIAWIERRDTEEFGGLSGLPSATDLDRQQSDSNSPDANSSDLQPADSSSESAAWRRYLSWHSGHRNQTNRGEPRVDLNQSDLRVLHQQLLQKWPAEWADYVVLYRQYGAIPSPPANALPKSDRTSASAIKSNSPQTVVQSPTKANLNSPPDGAIENAGPPNFGVPATRTIISPLEMIGAVTEIPSKAGAANDKSSKRRVASPFQPENTTVTNYLSKLLDEVTVSSDRVISDRIDITDAPLAVLMAIPGIDRMTAEALVQRRGSREGGGSNRDTGDNTIGWLLHEGVVNLDRLIQLEPYLTNRSDVYSCQVVGFRDKRSAVYRSTVTIDARQLPARLRDLQTWHSWDRGFSTESLDQHHLSNSK